MATWDRYKAPASGPTVTGLEIIARVGGRFQPRFYCDDPLGGVFTTKAPVAKLKLTPKVQFINTNIAWDVSESDSATGTIDEWDLNFGGGGATNLSAQDWAIDPKTGNIQYTTVGQYTASLVVRDTLGNQSMAAEQQVFIVDLQTINRVYIATDDSGLFVYDAGGTPTASNGTLTGGDIQFASGKLNPHFAHLPTSQHHWWGATANGISYTLDGGTTWATITNATLGDPTNTAGDGSPPDTDDLDNIAINYDPQDPRRVYLTRATDSTWNASFSPRVFLYWSDDYGAAWSSFGVGVT